MRFWWIFLALFTFCGADVKKGNGERKENSVKQIKLQKFFEEKFTYPVFMAENPIFDGVYYVVEQIGVIKVCESGKKCSVFLDIRDRVDFGGEKGLFSLAFSPWFKDDGRMFVSYTNKYAYSIISYFVLQDRKSSVDRKERVILKVRQPFPNHNGGMIAFGPDKFLYISFGDGGGAGDPLKNGQNKKTLLGKILRIDIRKFPYSIPQDNPFHKDALCGLGQKPSGGCAEIFAWGLRNPWRFSFDRDTGKIFAGDVGQNRWEEIDIIEKGKNYGWNCYEGFERYSDCEPDNYSPPVTVYPLYKEGDCSVIGGYVYRGKKINWLFGKYIFGDFCSGKIWYFNGKTNLLYDTDFSISSFAEDNERELYVIDHNGGIYAILPYED